MNSGEAIPRGKDVRPDRQTKVVIGGGFVLIIAIAGFLAVQVWQMNAAQARQEERFSGWQRSQEAWNSRIERTLERLTDEFRAFKEEMLKKDGGGK